VITVYFLAHHAGAMSVGEKVYGKNPPTPVTTPGSHGLKEKAWRTPLLGTGKVPLGGT
jgi:hypothetical protein